MPFRLPLGSRLAPSCVLPCCTAGLYIDSDVECFRDGADLLQGHDAVFQVRPGCCSCCLMQAAPFACCSLVCLLLWAYAAVYLPLLLLLLLLLRVHGALCARGAANMCVRPADGRQIPPLPCTTATSSLHSTACLPAHLPLQATHSAEGVTNAAMAARPGLEVFTRALELVQERQIKRSDVVGSVSGPCSPGGSNERCLLCWEGVRLQLWGPCRPCLPISPATTAAPPATCADASELGHAAAGCR